MACTLLTRIFCATRTSTTVPTNVTPAPYVHVQQERQTGVTAAARSVPSWAKLKKTNRTTMTPESFASVILFNIPDWIDQTYIECWLRTLPDIVQVRCKRSFRLSAQYDVVVDFKCGSDPFALMGITKEESIVVFDHQEVKIYTVTEGYNLTDAVVVSTFDLLPPLAHDPSTSVSRRNLKLDKLALTKAECCICRDVLIGPFSTPCWSCRRAVCPDCIRNHFQTALKDFGRFPAKCCDMAFHPDVAKAILPEDDLVRYRIRFEEWIAQHPFYCPVPTCSTFIPPRRLRLDKETTTVKCNACQTLICKICKQHAHLGQKCADIGQKAEDLDMITQFGYKQCPRCGIAVGKMYGCSHVQCNCGAHWCWECRRKIDVCNVAPCDGSYEDGYEELLRETMSDIDSVDGWDDKNPPSQIQEHEPEGDLKAPTLNMALSTVDSDILIAEPARVNDQDGSEVQQPTETLMQDVDNDHIHETFTGTVQLGSLALPHPEPPSHDNESISTTAPLQPTEQASAATDSKASKSEQAEFVNLDDPRSIAWDTVDLNFGTEPYDEDNLDIWGCIHNFEPAAYNRVPRFWMTASVPDWWDRAPEQREVGCMICWRDIKLAPKVGEIEKLDDGVEKRKMIKDWRFARRCRKCSIIVCRKCRNELVKGDA